MLLLCTQQLSYFLCPFLCLRAPFSSLIAGLWQPAALKSRHGAKFSQAVGLDFQSKLHKEGAVDRKHCAVLGSIAPCFFHMHTVFSLTKPGISKHGVS